MKLSHCHHMIDHYKGMLHKINYPMQTEFQLNGLSKKKSFTCNCIGKEDIFWTTSTSMTDDEYRELFNNAKSNFSFWAKDWRVLIEHKGFYVDGTPVNPNVIKVYEAVTDSNA
jgi:hypothetical protein